MKGIAVALLVLINAGIVFGIQGSSEWIRYNSAEGRYSVLVPTEPKLSTQESATAEGEKFTQYVASATDSNIVVVLGYFDHVPGTVFSLDKARDGMVAAIKGTLIDESAISLGGSPGRALKVSATGSDGVDYLVRARFYDIDKRVYVIQFILPIAADNRASAEKAARYFDSFQVTKTP